MAIPSSNNYQFTEDKEVEVGDPMAAADYGNKMASNTDYLKEAKCWGFDGNSDNGNSRASELMETGVIHIIKKIPIYEDSDTEAAVIVDISDGLPYNADGLKYRMLTLIPRLIAIGDGSHDTTDFIPSGSLDATLASNITTGANNDANTFSFDFLYPGPGVDINDIHTYNSEYQMKFENTFTSASIDLNIWVNNSGSATGNSAAGDAGDLMCILREESGGYDEYLLVMTVIYGPKWASIS